MLRIHSKFRKSMAMLGIKIDRFGVGLRIEPIGDGMFELFSSKRFVPFLQICFEQLLVKKRVLQVAGKHLFQIENLVVYRYFSGVVKRAFFRYGRLKYLLLESGQLKKQRDAGAEEKPADVGVKSDSGGLAGRGSGLDDLVCEPDGQNNERRATELAAPEKEEKKVEIQKLDSLFVTTYHERPHQACDGPGRSDQRDVGLGKHDGVDHARENSGKNVQSRIYDESPQVLELETGYPQVEHVEQQVPYAPVNEHRCKKRNKCSMGRNMAVLE